jgi:DNA-3-methyladenine glycosylase II
LNTTVLQKYSLTSPEICYLCSADKRLSVIIHKLGDLNYIIYTDTFSFLVKTIAGQMLSNKVADIISSRLENLCNGYICVDRIRSLNLEKLRSIGLSKQKAEFILELGEFFKENPSFFNNLALLPDDAVLRKLTELRGIGTWTAKMYLIFALNRLDILPYEDGAFLKVYKWLYSTEDISAKSIIKQCHSWRPYSSLAARYMYKALDSGLIQNYNLF